MTKIVIEAGIPVPPKKAFVGRGGRKSKYPFEDMQVGDSFAMPLGRQKKYPSNRGAVSYKNETLLRSAAHGCAKRNPGMRFTVRRLDDEGMVRVWRVA